VVRRALRCVLRAEGPEGRRARKGLELVVM
jgi:hypothetical protein